MTSNHSHRSHTAHCIDEGTIRLADKNEEMRTTPALSLCLSDELSVNYAKACINICLYMRSGVFELGSIKLMVGLRRVSTLIDRRPISSAIHLWVFFFRRYCKTMAISYDFVWDLQWSSAATHKHLYTEKIMDKGTLRTSTWKKIKINQKPA